MAHDTTADPVAREQQRAQTRLAVGGMLIPVFFVIMFATCIIGTYHAPHPNGIKVGVVGPAELTVQLRDNLANEVGSAFTVSAVATVDDAVHAVRERALNAAFVPTADPRQPATVIVATAGGRLTATAAESLARSVTAVQGTQLVVRDVRPLTGGDPIGVGVFMFTIVCTICGYLTVTILFTLAPALSASRRYPMIAAVSVLIPTFAYLIGGLGFGTYTGSVGAIFAFVGVGALYTFVIGLVTRLLQVVLGPPAIFVSLALFIFVNIPSLGATYTNTMLSSFWRFFNHFWLGAETVNAERSILYFNGDGVGGDLLRLLAWTGVCVVLLLPPVSRKLRREHLTVTGDVQPERQLLAIDT